MLRVRARNKGLYYRVLTIEVGCTDEAVDVPRLAVNTHLSTAYLFARTHSGLLYFSFLYSLLVCPIVVHLSYVPFQM